MLGNAKAFSSHGAGGAGVVGIAAGGATTDGLGIRCLIGTETVIIAANSLRIVPNMICLHENSVLDVKGQVMIT